MKKVTLLMAIATSLLFSCIQQKGAGKEIPASNSKIVLAYLTGWNPAMPDPSVLTHINYAFGQVNETFNGVNITNPDKLMQVAKLKEQFPDLKICLSIGGWRSGRFSEMAADEVTRKAFAVDCRRIVDSFGIDGIDMDWEYPTSKAAGISASPEDTKNFTLLMSDIRKAIGADKLLTLATVADAKFIDFRAIDNDIDFVNVMTYDVGRPPYHHSGLYRSEHSGYITTEEALLAHIDSGVPLNKIVMGIPFYGHGKGDLPDFIDYKDIVQLTKFQKHWDDVAKVPYLTDDTGRFVCCYEDAESIKYKCEYILSKHLRGAMYWEYAADTPEGTLRNAVYYGIYPKQP